WGAGPPLVFVHGASDTSRSFLPTVARLAPHFSCVAYDLPNGYDDGARLGRYTHDLLVEDLWALLDHLKLERTYALGSSFGCTVVLRALAARPGRLPRAVLQGGLAYRPLRPAERLPARRGRFLPGPVARIRLREKILRETSRFGFEEREPSVWRAFVDWTGQARIKAFAHQALWLNGLDLRPLLPSIRQPVLLVCGERDRVVPSGLTDVLGRGLPNAGPVVIPGCAPLPSFPHPHVY